jgi:hypothetical protein
MCEEHDDMTEIACPAASPQNGAQTGKRMTRPHAAYVLGYNPYAFRLFEHDGEADNPLKALLQLSAAIDLLAPDIRCDVLPDLRDEINDLYTIWMELHDYWCTGKDYKGPFLSPDHGEGLDKRQRLCTLAQESLPSDHPLYALVQFGLTLGEYELAEYYVSRDRARVKDASRAAAQQLPDLSKLVRRAESLPPWLLKSLPEVPRLIEFGLRLNDLGACVFAERILGPLPAGFRTFMPVLAIFDFFFYLNERVQKQLRQITDEQVLLKPRWVKAERKLWYGSTLCAKYCSLAKRQMKILDVFEEDQWAERIDDPLDEGLLPDTIKGLQRKRKGKPILFERDGTGEGICWRPRRW